MTSSIILEQTPELVSLMTIIRNKETPREDFIFYSDRVIRLLVEEGISLIITLIQALNYLPYYEKVVSTPTGAEYKGLAFKGEICGVSIMRAGEAMEQGLRDCCRLTYFTFNVHQQKRENRQDFDTER